MNNLCWTCSQCHKPIENDGAVYVNENQIDAMHYECVPLGLTDYVIPCNRAKTENEWLRWCIHLGDKTWVTKDTLSMLLDYWLANRGQSRAI